jgi:hypothetical protein
MKLSKGTIEVTYMKWTKERRAAERTTTDKALTAIPAASSLRGRVGRDGRERKREKRKTKRN